MVKKIIARVIYIFILLITIAFCIQKIVKSTGSGGVYNNGTTWETTKWGYYAVILEGEDSEEKDKKTGQYDKDDVVDQMQQTGFYYDDLKDNGEIFCIEKGIQLPSKHDEDDIRKMGTGTTLGDQYHDGSVVAQVSSAESLSNEEIKALETKDSNASMAIRRRFL